MAFVKYENKAREECPYLVGDKVIAVTRADMQSGYYEECTVSYPPKMA